MAEGLVDLRSDTVTRPTPEMRRAMAGAEVGDDVYGEDPTVRALEEAFAERVGKQAALYVPSGVMGNQVALRTLARPGSLVVAGRRQHVVAYENGAAGRNAGVQFWAADDADGTIDPAEVALARESPAHHWPEPALVCIENTHMAAGGVPWPQASLGALAASAGPLPVHMDGARLFNAEIATGVPASALAAPATTVMCCLSKGLCAPVGSLLAGPADAMAQARAERAVLGGAMRQAGVIAAAGLVALESMVERLSEDHRRAARLARAVAERWPASPGPASPGPAGPGPASPGPVRAGSGVPTNIVVFGHDRPQLLLDHLAQAGVLAGTIAPGVVRLVTHRDVDDEGVERAVKALALAP